MTHNLTNAPTNTLPKVGKVGVEHTPFDASFWTGRHEPDESPRALYWYQVVKDFAKHTSVATDPAKVTIIGFACDQGVRRNLGRVGAKYAPPAIRQAFAKLPISAAIQDKFSAENHHLRLADAGDIVCHDNDTLMDDILEQTQDRYSQLVTNIINQGSLAIGLGGGHAIAYASYMGLWHALNANVDTDGNAQSNIDTPTAPCIGIINFDAHLDIRNAPKGTSGTPFRQIAQHNQLHNQTFHYCAIGISQFSNTAALFERAYELGITIISDDDCARMPWSALEKQLLTFIAQVDVIYLTIDMDGFAASIVPGVSAPAAKGISVDFVERCLEVIITSGKVKVADIAEINPTYDIDGRSSKVAARLLALIIEHHLMSNC